jgi:hypothetical protein
MESERRDQAVAALAELDEGREAQRRIATPWWFYPAVGVLMGLWPLALGLKLFLVLLPIEAVVLGGAYLLRRAARQRMGVTVNPLRLGPAAVALFTAYLVASVALLTPVGILNIVQEQTPLWIGVACGLGEVVVSVLYGVALEHLRTRR